MNIHDCIKIYKAAFGSSEPFDTMLFESFSDCIHTMEADGKTVSMLFSLPCILNYRDKKLKLNYIYAAATDWEYRGRGYMSALIKNVQQNSDAPLFLKPASESLQDFYQNLGFKRINAVSNMADAYITVDKKWEQLSSLCDSCPKNYILMYSGNIPPEITKLSFPHTMG